MDPVQAGYWQGLPLGPLVNWSPEWGWQGYQAKSQKPWLGALASKSKEMISLNLPIGLDALASPNLVTSGPLLTRPQAAVGNGVGGMGVWGFILTTLFRWCDDSERHCPMSLPFSPGTSSNLHWEWNPVHLRNSATFWPLQQIPSLLLFIGCALNWYRHLNRSIMWQKDAFTSVGKFLAIGNVSLKHEI